MMLKIDLKLNKKQIKVFIDNILHLSIKRDELIGIQSWIMGYDDNRKYHIEYTTKTSVIESEYDKLEKWQAILKLLDENEII